MKFEVKVTLPTGESVDCQTRNISDTGTFIYHLGKFELALNDVITIAVVGIPGDPPVKTMKVVRIEETGYGLIFAD